MLSFLPPGFADTIVVEFKSMLPWLPLCGCCWCCRGGDDVILLVELQLPPVRCELLLLCKSYKFLCCCCCCCCCWRTLFTTSPLLNKPGWWWWWWKFPLFRLYDVVGEGKGDIWLLAEWWWRGKWLEDGIVSRLLLALVICSNRPFSTTGWGGDSWGWWWFRAGGVVFPPVLPKAETQIVSWFD